MYNRALSSTDAGFLYSVTPSNQGLNSAYLCSACASGYFSSSSKCVGKKLNYI